MSRFVNRTATDIIEMDNKDKVWVRQKLTALEQSELDKNLIRMELKADTQTPEMKMGDWHRQRIEICRAFVVNWDFKDDNGEIVVFNAELMEELDSETINEIATKIDLLQRARLEDSEKKVNKRSAK